MKTTHCKPYKLTNHVRVVTATSLFDGHDVSINMMRRILQASGAEVIHIGHNRSVAEIVNCAIQEDVQAIAVTSYQGGHLEYFKYMVDLLKEQGASHIKVFGGGGGTILPVEIEELQAYGISRIYSPDDGRRLGLQGMINDLLERADSPTTKYSRSEDIGKLKNRDFRVIGNWISVAENEPEQFRTTYQPELKASVNYTVPVIGVTGTGGSGKSTLLDELIRRYLIDFPESNIAVVSMDPSKQKTGGALLGDRIRMNSICDSRVYMRSMATRQVNSSLSKSIADAIQICQSATFNCIFLETAGIGQSGSEVLDWCDVSLYVMTPEYGAASQLEKIDMLDYAHLIVINKFDKAGSSDALKAVQEQLIANIKIETRSQGDFFVFGTVAAQYNDNAIDLLYQSLIREIGKNFKIASNRNFKPFGATQRNDFVIPPARSKYLEEIVKTNREYDKHVEDQAAIAQKLFQLHGTLQMVKAIEYEKLLQSNGSDDVIEGHILSADVRENNFRKHGIVAKGNVGDPVAEAENDISLNLELLYQQTESKLDKYAKTVLEEWNDFRTTYQKSSLQYDVSGKFLESELYSTSLSNVKIPKISIPNYQNWGDIIRWTFQENVPGKFPYTSGVFPLRRNEGAPTRMTAGEGGPERSNTRFHYLCRGKVSKRISTAHDSVTLYGEDPDFRPDIYGKIGSTGVSVCNLDDTKKLYSGFNLADPNTSVNLTINGPAPAILAFFLNAAIDQQCELYLREQGRESETREKIALGFQARNLSLPYYNGILPEGNDSLGLLLLGVTGDQILEREVYEKIKSSTLSSLRGTVQSDILKEEQAQNTCIFSSEFSLRMMGDIQEYFIKKQIRNFYSVSVSGYHIAEAGANPITQLAFTLANAFTFIEYFLSRGMKIDEFAPNMSFFFSNGMDAEYAVLGRVARRIWAKTIKLKYHGNERSQKLKYHIQTSGRSLHAQEIEYNDIRTTLQAWYALFDNCNSLHTNASDEAITLPTEKSVKRAMAIQLIIDKEFGLSRSENPLQGSFIIDELTKKVEEAVLQEFDNLSARGGVIGSMERMYQRSKIQEESMHYETLKHAGKLPIIGVNTFLSDDGSPTIIPNDVIRLTKEERDFAIYSKTLFQQRNELEANRLLEDLKNAAQRQENIFGHLMDTCKVCTLGQVSQALYQIGGQYRRYT